MKAPKQAGVDKEPGFKLFRKTRGGVALTREEVKEIKAGRKKLRKEMKERKIYSKYEFEAMASALGLYFDKRKGLLFLLFSGGRGIWVLLGAAILTVLALFGMALVSQMRGYFTINLSDKMHSQGFVLSDTMDFKNPTSYLFAEPSEVICVSIADIPSYVDEGEGLHADTEYFAYTHFVRNEGHLTATYTWRLKIVGESQKLSSAVWVMVIEDGKMSLFAKAHEDGTIETLPALDDNTRGYINIPAMGLVENANDYLQPIKKVGNITYNRVLTQPFEDKYIIASGIKSEVHPGEVHKYTIVMWLEGDDPECVDDLIGGHLGVTMAYTMVDEEEEEQSFIEKMWDRLNFWEKDDFEHFWQNIWDSLSSWGEEPTQ